MRKFAWLTLVAATVLFFSAPESAFAHAAHNHTQQVQNTPAQQSAPALAEHDQKAEQFLSVSSSDYGDCPHKHQHSDCGFCCACAGGASVALVTPEMPSTETQTPAVHYLFRVAYAVRQNVVDLSRPPKSVA